MVGNHPGGVELVGRPFWRSGSGRETLLVVRKWSEIIPEVWNWLEDLIGGPEVVGRTSRRSGTGLGDLIGGPEVVERPSQRSGTGREILPEARN